MARKNENGGKFRNVHYRGIGAVGMLAETKGVDQGTMYDMISKGKVSGREAAEIILQAMTESFSGSMLAHSRTFSGLSSTVEGLSQELDNAMGQGYNEGRMKGLGAQKEWLAGESGAVIRERRPAGELRRGVFTLSSRSCNCSSSSPQYTQCWVLRWPWSRRSG